MSAAQRRARRERAAACMLIALGGVLMMLAASRTWASATVTQPPLPPRRIAVTGADLSAVVRALGLLALAGAAALVALRGWWRAAAGLLLAGAGVAAVLAFGSSSADGVRRSAPVATQRDTGAQVAVSARTGWPYGYLAGGVAVAVAGGLTVLRGRGWPDLGARYEAPVGRGTAAADPWTTLDRGEDPTVG